MGTRSNPSNKVRELVLSAVLACMVRLTLAMVGTLPQTITAVRQRKR